MTVVLMTGPALEFVHREEVAAKYSPLPGVVTWGSRVFVFAYSENPESHVYRETFALALTKGKP